MDLAEATGQVTTVTEVLQESIYRFDDQRQLDLRKVLDEFIYAELNYHAKALEILTEAAQLVRKM